MTMNRIGVFLLVTALAALLLVGCGEDDLAPYFTRLDTSGDCGVVPFDVEFYAIATGGNEFEDPTGANLYLEINWDFGDGQKASGSSIVYHTFSQPDTYAVRVTVKDEDGDSATREVTITVLADTLSVWAESDPPATVLVGEEVSIESYAAACGFDPDPEIGDYSRFQIRWYLDAQTDVFKRGRSFTYTPTADDVGPHTLTVKYNDPALAIRRQATLPVEVVQPPR